MSTESGFHLAGGELTVTGPAEQLIADGRQVDFGVTAALFGGADGDVVMLAGWSNAEPDGAQSGGAHGTGSADGTGGVRSEGGRTVLPLRTQPVVLNSLPRSVRVRLSTTPEVTDTESAWQLVLRFRNQAGSGLTWRAGLPAEAFGPGWSAPLADLLTIDNKATEATTGEEEVRVVHHTDDEYYELLVDGEQAGLLIYHVIGSHLAITHTVIEPTYRGRGLSWVLVGRALDDIRTKSVKVSNYCTVVRRFVELNPEYGDLLGVA